MPKGKHAVRSAVSSIWLRLVWSLCLLTSLAGLLLALPAIVTVSATTEVVLVLMALLTYVPYLPARYSLQVASDAFLIEYDSARSPSVVYWSNVGVVIVSWPVLGIVWAVTTVVPTRSQERA